MDKMTTKEVVSFAQEAIKNLNDRGADLRGAKNYLNSHDFFQEIVKRHPLKDFTEKEWAMIGQILVYRLCWGSIKKRYDKEIMPVFKKLSKVGFQEWAEHYKTV
jgi:hypothetical protein